MEFYYRGEHIPHREYEHSRPVRIIQLTPNITKTAYAGDEDLVITQPDGTVRRFTSRHERLIIIDAARDRIDIAGEEVAG